MNWEETIIYIQDKKEYQKLISDAYLSIDLKQNVNAYKISPEFIEVLRLLSEYSEGTNKNLLDIGSGNGISALSFALNGYKTTAFEPDPSSIVGYNAIKKLKNVYKINNLDVFNGYGENIPFEDNSFDIVFVRQTLHHAQNLQKFINEAHRVLKKGGIFFSVRDHVIYNKKDKEKFLKTHPLNKFYGGENAFTKNEYITGIKNSGLTLIKEFSHFDTVINYHPLTKEEIESEVLNSDIQKFVNIKQRFGNLIFNIYKRLLYAKYGNPFKEKNILGRLYSFIAKK